MNVNFTLVICASLLAANLIFAAEKNETMSLNSSPSTTTKPTTVNFSTEKSSSTPTITMKSAIKKTTATTQVITEMTTKTTTDPKLSSTKPTTPINKKSTTGICELTKIVLCRHLFQEQHECIEKCLPGHIFVDHHKKEAWKCDGWSFFGGIMSTIAIMAISLIAYKYAKRSKEKNPEHNYSLM